MVKLQDAFITTSGGDEDDSGVRNIYGTMRDCAAFLGSGEPKFLYYGLCGDPAVFKADPANAEKAAAFGRSL